MGVLGAWEHMLAAFICAGILQTIFGTFKLGGLADFIPSSVVQGMMAAIGVIILAGQIHPGLGVEIGKMNDFSKLIAIPNSIANMNPLIAVIFFTPTGNQQVYKVRSCTNLVGTFGYSAIYVFSILHWWSNNNFWKNTCLKRY
jgi:MFS superfamily sulfate permease-like transporter